MLGGRQLCGSNWAKSRCLSVGSRSYTSFNPEGRTGSIPLRPVDLDLAPLDAWVADVSLHARRQTVAPEREAA